MSEIPGTPVHSSASTSSFFAMSTPTETSAGVNASGGTASLGASVKYSHHMFLKTTRRMIAFRLSWDGGLPAS